ncbi:MAG: DUF5362 family protein [Dysgonamonadaceae bacterium]|jgi:hypothetical protein|nr:DUF5362 family protein [Dysgonamonadaceae bacterium]
MKNSDNSVTDKVTVNTTEPVIENSGLQITDQARKYLRAMRQWTKFFSVLYWIGTGILAVKIFRELFEMIGGGSVGALVGIISEILIAILLFMLGTDLHLFSKFMKSALSNNDSEEMEYAFMNMKSYWKLLGILIIIFIFLSAVTFVLADLLRF